MEVRARMRLRTIKMKILLSWLLSVCLVGFIFQTQGIAEVPAWVTSPPEVFLKPSKERDAITVVGVATARTLEESRQAAILDAARQVVEYIVTTLQVQGERIRTEVESRLKEEMKFSSERVLLRGGILKEWYFREIGGEHQSFVLVRYPRKEIEDVKSSIQAAQAELITRARMNIQKGDAAWKRGALMDALSSYSETLQAAYGANHAMLQSEARNRITSLLQSLEISIVSGDGQEVKPGGRQQTLVAGVTTLNGGRQIPAAGIPVRFSLVGTEDKKSVSVIADSNGEARINPDQLGFRSSIGTYRVLTKIDYDTLFNRFLSPSASNEAVGAGGLMAAEIPGVSFTLKVIPVPRNTRVLILIDESNMGHVSTESIVLQLLSQALQQAGFRVVATHEIGRSNVERLQEAIRKDLLWPVRPELSSQVRLVISGTATTRRGSDNMGLAISSHADLFIKAIDLESGEVVAQKNLTSVAGFGERAELAGIRALEKAGGMVAGDIVNQLSLWEEVKGHDNQ